MIIQVDSEGAETIEKLVDVMLKQHGIKGLQFAKEILDGTALLESAETDDGPFE